MCVFVVENCGCRSEITGKWKQIQNQEESAKSRFEKSVKMPTCNFCPVVLGMNENIKIPIYQHIYREHRQQAVVISTLFLRNFKK